MLWRLDACELAELRDVTARDVVEAHRDRIRAINPALNAIVLESPFSDVTAGPLHRVPFTVKDVFSTANLRTTAGSPGLATSIPDVDAAAVTLLRNAGGALLGKTNTPAFSADIQCSSPLLGRANNPWNPGFSTGGSTGGGAAAVASGMSALELGSDHGGSLRIPASFCGVVGFKPTGGLVPMTGHVHPFGVATENQHRIICAGPIARRVRDIRLAMRILGQIDINDTSKYHFRIAVIPKVEGFPIDRDVGDALDRTASLLERVTRASLPAASWLDAFSSWSTLITEELSSPLVAAARAWWRSTVGGPRVVDAVRAAHEKRLELISVVDSLLADHDAILLPTTLTPAFTHRPTGTAIDVDGHATDYWLAAGAATSLASLTGHPAIALPTTLSRNGLPLSVQLIGRRNGDAALLDVAETVESLFERLPFPL